MSEWFANAGSINGGGLWIGTSGTRGGMSGATYYGSTAPGGYNSAVTGGSWSQGAGGGWGNAASAAASASGGSGSYGGVSWGAEGILTNGPMFAGIGEAGQEMVLPNPITETIMSLVNDHASLPNVLQKLGIQAQVGAVYSQIHAVTGRGSMSSVQAQSIINGALSQMSAYSGGVSVAMPEKIEININGSADEATIKTIMAELTQVLANAEARVKADFEASIRKAKADLQAAHFRAKNFTGA